MMSQKKALICDAIIGEEMIGRIEHYLQTDWELVAVSKSNPQRQCSEAADADALIGHDLRAELLQCARALKLVQCTGAGINGIAVDAIPEDVALCNVYEHEIPIAEYVMMGVLMFACRVKHLEAELRRGRWVGSGRVYGTFHGEVYQKTIGLIGLGRIGREVAKRAKAFGMRVLALRQKARRDADADTCFGYDQLHAFLEQCDYVVVSCPLIEQTRGLIGSAELCVMRESAVLINPSRGEILQEKPLFDALSNQTIGGAMLDAWYQYPDTGEIGYGSQYPFHELSNVIMTPHMAAWTSPMLDRRSQVIAENLNRLFRNEPLHNQM